MPRKKPAAAPARARSAHPKARRRAKPETASDDGPTLEAPAQAPTAEADRERPARPGLPFPIVAIGASAGGIEAIVRLLQALPRGPGMALVVIQHLSPTHESMLAEILARATPMPVAEVAGDTPVEPDHVYVIPPNRSLAFAKGRLTLAPRLEQRGQPCPIDHFMRSLAEEHGHRAIGVVLSGASTDGTLGLEEIKAAGGITFSQDSTAGQESMPRSAIAAGVVDFVLPPDEIARELARIARHPLVRPPDAEVPLAEHPAFGRVLDRLRVATGVDFSRYKRNTLQRRITRRMVLHKLDRLQDYLALLQSAPHEVEALYQDVLINVTSFFRDPEGFEALKSLVFPKLTEERSPHEPVRVWSLGCSTGEESYSIAIAYAEYCEESGRRVPLQIFATDVNGAGIDKARAGEYSKSIAEDVSPERLRRFFAETDGTYRVAKSIRELCVFARHNALSDPPFSRMDLIASRNLLIYLEPALQQRLIPLLHYALSPAGFLWLGTSETIGTYRDLFELVDAKKKIYARRPAKRLPTVTVPIAGPRRSSASGAAAPAVSLRREVGATDPMREADRLLLSRYVPPSVLVDENDQVLQFRGDTGAYLAPAPGRASLDLLKMLREGLLVGVRAALQRARREKGTVREEGLRVRSDGDWREVDIVVMPVHAGDGTEGGFLVLFEEPVDRRERRMNALAAAAKAAANRARPERDESSRQEIARLKNELTATREYLQSVIEQQESANEELQSANEEVQSANEELQSINEELETSKEEIQSGNEELATVNEELQNRNVELSQANDDFLNLLASVNLPIVMVGADLRIRRFTPPAEKMLGLIRGDIGRPLGDIQLGLDLPDLRRTVADVIENVATHEREVRDREGRWFSLRIRPYRTLENRIDGAVLVLVDIDGLKRAEQSLRESEERFEALADTAPVLMWVSDLDECRFVNRAFEEFVGEPEERIRKLGQSHFVHPDERQEYVDGFAAARRERRRFDMRLRFRRADGAYRWMKSVALPRLAEDGTLAGFVGCNFDITDLAEAEAALRELDRGRNEFLAILAHELRNPLSGVMNAGRLLGQPASSEVVEKARAIIERQATRMVQLIDDLLDVSRVTYGKIRLRMQPLDLAACLRRSIEATEGEREAMQQGFEAAIPPGELAVSGDPVRLEQVFTNLLVNASKFTRHGGRIWLTVEKERVHPDTQPRVAVRVRDNGVGIDAAMLPRIFDLFAQAEGQELTRGGIGLGLTLAKRLVDLHGGTIEALSAGSSLGSEFVVRLPLLAAPARPHADAREPGAKDARRTPRRVLVVDDNGDSGESLRHLFELAGHQARLVTHGAQAVPVAAEFRPDVVLLDIALPDMDGYEVARELRKDVRTRGVYIVAVTGYGRDDDRARSLEAGMDAHMTKPVDVDMLMEQVARARNAGRSNSAA